MTETFDSGVLTGSLYISVQTLSRLPSYRTKIESCGLLVIAPRIEPMSVSILPRIERKVIREVSELILRISSHLREPEITPTPAHTAHSTPFDFLIKRDTEI